MPATQSELPPIQLRPDIGELVRLVGYIEEFCVLHEMGHADCHAFMLAAEELFANSLSHGNPRASSIEFSLSIAGESVSAVYSDDGSLFDPTSRPEAGTTLPLEQRPIGGLGIHFIRRTMSTFLYQRDCDRNVIIFGRNLIRADRTAQPDQIS